jgi:hypothetical protein
LDQQRFRLADEEIQPRLALSKLVDAAGGECGDQA